MNDLAKAAAHQNILYVHSLKSNSRTCAALLRKHAELPVLSTRSGNPSLALNQPVVNTAACNESHDLATCALLPQSDKAVSPSARDQVGLVDITKKVHDWANFRPGRFVLTSTRSGRPILLGTYMPPVHLIRYRKIEASNFCNSIGWTARNMQGKSSRLTVVAKSNAHALPYCRSVSDPTMSIFQL